MDDQQTLQTHNATVSRRTRRVRILAGVIAVILIAAGLTTWRIATRPTPIHIAFANTLSGPLAPTGNEDLTAARLYMDEVNRQGGVDGHPIVLDLVDDKGDQATARANVKQIADGPAVAVLGHFLSALSIAFSRLTSSGGTPLRMLAWDSARRSRRLRARARSLVMNAWASYP